MSTGIELLRMLEPAVRPGGLQGPRTAPHEPIESRSFDSLLEEAKARPQAGEPAAQAASGRTKSDDPLGALARVDLIDNAALLRIIGTNQAGAVSLTE